MRNKITVPKQEVLEDMLSNFFNSTGQAPSANNSINQDLMKELQIHARYWKEEDLPSELMAPSFCNEIIRLSIEYGLSLTAEEVSRVQEIWETHLRWEERHSYLQSLI